MISGIRFCYHHSLKIKGPREIQFMPGFNVLVGPNGSGKSTILRSIHTCEECEKQNDEHGEIHYFNIEMMNPHSFSGAMGDMRNMILRTRGVFSSHGEIMKAALGSLPIRRGDLLLVDEPESGQDAAGVQRIRHGFEMICAEGCQVIAASHHPFMWGDAHIIELVPGYVKQVQEHYSKSMGLDPEGEEKDGRAR